MKAIYECSNHVVKRACSTMYVHVHVRTCSVCKCIIPHVCDKRLAVAIWQDELRRLKVENQGLREQQKRWVASGSSVPSSPLKELASVELFGSQDHAPSGQAPPLPWSEARVEPATGSLGQFVGQDGGRHDGWGGKKGDVVDGGGGVMSDWEDAFQNFSDVVKSQNEISRLQSELSRQRMECQHWRSIAQEKVSLN